MDLVQAHRDPRDDRTEGHPDGMAAQKPCKRLATLRRSKVAMGRVQNGKDLWKRFPLLEPPRDAKQGKRRGCRTANRRVGARSNA
eukprot:scaffold26659_cov35-Tisochrysis_lutea.AAC.3